MVSRSNCTKQPDQKRTFWHNDGPDEHTSSLSVILEWINRGNNYDRWKGADAANGKTKKILALEILAEIKQQGITTERHPKDVISKIASLEMSFRKAVYFRDATGAGTTDEATLEAEILKICPYYYNLLPVMGCRPSCRPPVNTTDLEYITINEGGEETVENEVEQPDGGGVAKKSLPNSPPLKKYKTIRKDTATPLAMVQATLGLMNYKKEEWVHKEKLHKEEREFKERELKLKEEEAADKAALARAKLKQIEEDTKTKEIERHALLVQKRLDLLKAGASKEEVDKMLPLPK